MASINTFQSLMPMMKQVYAKQPKDLTVQNAPKFKKIAAFLKEAKKKKKS